MHKRIVLSGYFGFKNFGDEAILSVLINKLSEYRARITVISSDTTYTKSRYKHIRAVKTFDILNIAGFISKSDILISGGGSLLQDVTSFKSLIYYLFIIFLGLLFKKKVIIFAQGIGPLRNPAGKLLTSAILTHCDYISVRDKKSYELLKKMGIKSELLCDPIFSLKIPETEKMETVGVQLRNCRQMNADFIDRLASAICSNFSGEKIEIYSFQDSYDLEVCKSLKKNINLLNSNMEVEIFSELSNTEIINRIRFCRYLIAMRFHAVIIGLLSKCKVLSINYDIKVEKISEEFSLPMLDLRKDFGNRFSQLISQKLPVVSKRFDWSGVEKFLS